MTNLGAVLVQLKKSATSWIAQSWHWAVAQAVQAAADASFRLKLVKEIAAFTHAEQLLFTPSGVLSRHDADPRCEIAPSAKRCPVADGGQSTSGKQEGHW